MSYFLLIEIIGSILYLTQKILLSFRKRIGWLFGILGSVAFTIVTIHKHSYAYSILEISSGVIFIFGLLLWQRFETVQKHLTFLMSGIVMLGIVAMAILNIHSPHWILEISMVLLFAVGAVLLVIRNPIGWILYGLGHILLIIYAHILGTYSILILQVVSLPFAYIGYKNFTRGRHEKTP